MTDECVRWISPPRQNLGYFWRATAKDGRPDMVHEGVPGHYFQMCLSWKHEDPIRQHYYDSGANEGLGFYAEEMMLQAGVFDDSPPSREINYNYKRVGALRGEDDVKNAHGEVTADQTRNTPLRTVPLGGTTGTAG